MPPIRTPSAIDPSGIRADNATKNILQAGGGNRIVMAHTASAQYIHIASPHHGTYLHLGAPFNPQYNHVTNTKGTSLSYTQDISTSLMGTDAHTIVEASRLTVIGRARMTPDDLGGQQIAQVISREFVADDGNATDKAIAKIFAGTSQGTAGNK